MISPELDFIFQMGVQFTFMVLFFLERKSHDETRNRLEQAHDATREELRRVLLHMAGIPADDLPRVERRARVYDSPDDWSERPPTNPTRPANFNPQNSISPTGP